MKTGSWAAVPMITLVAAVVAVDRLRLLVLVAEEVKMLPEVAELQEVRRRVEGRNKQVSRCFRRLLLSIVVTLWLVSGMFSHINVEMVVVFEI